MTPVHCHARRGRDDRGFSLLEALVATAVLVLLTGSVFGLVAPGSGTGRAQPEVSDMQQRLRVAVDALRRDLAMAGAGTYTGAAVGPLVTAFAPLLPYATGPLVTGGPDAPDPAAITVLHVPATASQAKTRSELGPGTTTVRIEPVGGCPAGAARTCGFETGMRVVVFQDDGAHDVFTVTGVEGDEVHLSHRDRGLTNTYAPGASISQVVAVSYHLHRAERRLYRYDGHLTNLPLVDDVVGLRFEYFGEPAPPVLLVPVTQVAGPWTTYGPRPPPAGLASANGDWGPGENCTFTLLAGQHVGRLADWRGAASSALVPLPLASLSDGPWCPGRTTAGGVVQANRFDADLLRIRRVRVTVRVQVASPSLRGSNPPETVWFVQPGSARSGERFIRDQEMRFEVTPRNLNLGW